MKLGGPSLLLCLTFTRSSVALTLSWASTRNLKAGALAVAVFPLCLFVASVVDGNVDSKHWIGKLI